MSTSLAMEKLERNLVGARFSLIPFREEHTCGRYIRWLNDPEVNRFLEVQFVPQTHETVLGFVRSFYSPVEKYIWGIYSNLDRQLIGTSTLYEINRNHGSAHIGLMVGEKSYWGKGASDEAIGLVAQFSFETLGLRRLTAGTCSRNHGMNFTFKKLGFTLEGKLRKAFLLGPGIYADIYYWGILVEEWRARHCGGTRQKLQHDA